LGWGFATSGLTTEANRLQSNAQRAKGYPMSKVERVRTGTSTLRQALCAWKGIDLRSILRCEGCETSEAADNPIQVHHIVPWVAGGTDDPRNLVFVCRGCHTSAHEILDHDGGLVFLRDRLNSIPIAREAWFYIIGMKHGVEGVAQMAAKKQLPGCPADLKELL
jgi:hypothetical protein